MPREFQFIDDMAKPDSEKWCQQGPCEFKEARRPSRKTYSNMKFLCNSIESKASKAGTDTSDWCLDNVRKMFHAALKELIIPADRNQ
jgi:hypothetical protein